LNEKDIIDVQIITKKHFPPIHNRLPGYSCGVLSPFRKRPDELVPFCWVTQVKFVSYHILSHLFSSKDKDNLLNGVRHPEGPFLSDSRFEPVIKA
jgi:hypothetical protein